MSEKINLRPVLLIAVLLSLIGISPKILKNPASDFTLPIYYFFYIGLTFLSFYAFNRFLWFMMPARSYSLKYALGYLGSFMGLVFFHGLVWSINRDGFIYFFGLKTILPAQILFITAFRAFLLQSAVLLCLFFFKNKEEKMIFQLEIDRLNEYLDTLKSKSNPEKSYKNTLITRFKNQVLPIDISEIAFFHLSEGIVFQHLFSNQKYIQPMSLESLESTLDPQLFFRANRQYLVHRNAVAKIEQIEYRKLKVTLTQPTPEDIVVSKVKAGSFIRWLESK